MIIVPVAGDRIKTTDGLPSKVVSFTNLQSEGPAVFVEGQEGSQISTVPLREIAELNGKKVKFVKNAGGYKILETDGYIERKEHLPQPGDTVKSSASGEPQKYKVNRLRLGVPDQLSKGLILDVEDPESQEPFELTLGQINDVDRSVFNRAQFLKYYADYREKGSA